MLFLSKSFVFYAISLLFWWISFTIKDAQRLDRCIGRIVHRSRSADNIRSLDAGKPTVVHPQVRLWTQSQPAATIGCSPKSADWSAALEKRLALLRSPNCEFQFRDSRDSRSTLALFRDSLRSRSFTVFRGDRFSDASSSPVSVWSPPNERRRTAS